MCRFLKIKSGTVSAREVGGSIKPGVRTPGSHTNNNLAREGGRQPLRFFRKIYRPLRGLTQKIHVFPGVSRIRASPQALCYRPFHGLKRNDVFREKC
jgi:hypothetical protein